MKNIPGHIENPHDFLIIADRAEWFSFSDVPQDHFILLSQKILSPFEKNTVFTLFIWEPAGTNLVLC
jgi:hypothetical protein